MSVCVCFSLKETNTHTYPGNREHMCLTNTLQLCWKGNPTRLLKCVSTLMEMTPQACGFTWVCFDMVHFVEVFWDEELLKDRNKEHYRKMIQWLSFIHVHTLMWSQTQMTFILLWNTKWDVVFTVLFLYTDQVLKTQKGQKKVLFMHHISPSIVPTVYKTLFKSLGSVMI